MSDVFISYRRTDTQGTAGRLCDFLAQNGVDVFFDTSSLAAGEPWPRRIRSELKIARVVLAIIGEGWISSKAPSGRMRLDEQGDWVRNEITSALKLGKTVIPVLVDRAKLPAAESMPEVMRRLLKCSSVPLRNDSWEADAGFLLNRIGVPGDISGKPAASPAIAAFTGRERAHEGIGKILEPLSAGDRVIVVGRTCFNWLAVPAGQEKVKEAIARDIQITFIVQDLFDYLAEEAFSALSADLAEAESGFETLLKDLAQAGKSRLLLKYSATEIRNSRTLCILAKQRAMIRYDLTMADGPKPYVVIRDPVLAAPIIEETLRLDRESLSREDFKLVTGQRTNEEKLRGEIGIAAQRHYFRSEVRGNWPLRLVKQSSRVRLARIGGRPPPAPLSVQILLTQGCAARCAMCSYFRLPKTHPSNRLKTDDVIGLLDDVASMGTRAVVLSGGEPLILNDIDRVLRHCSTKRLKVGLLTSGLVPEQKREAVLKAVAECCSWVQVSVDSFAKATYAAIRNAEGKPRPGRVDLSACEGFIWELRQRSTAAEVEICYTIQSGNISELLSPVQLKEEILKQVPPGVPVRFKFASGTGATDSGEPGNGEFLLREDQVRDLATSWRNHAALLKQVGCNADYIANMASENAEAISKGYPVERLRKNLLAQRCEVTNYHLFVDSVGDVYPCCYLYNDNVASWKYRAGFHVANWLDHRQRKPTKNALKAIWDGPEFESIRERRIADFPKEACGRCTRHMQQNGFLSSIGGAMDRLDDGPDLDRATAVFEDPTDPRLRPIWL